MNSSTITRGAGLFFLAMFLCIVTHRAVAQSLVSDNNDYPPGSTVTLTGTSFSSGETVTLQVLHADGTGDNDSSAAHLPWNVSADGDGGFVTTWIVPADQDEEGASLVASANGQLSGGQAQAFFTDGQPDGTGVVTVTANNGSCLGFTAAVGAGPDNWEVAEGESYTMTITGVTECTGTAITVFVQNSNSGNFCFTATGGSGTYSATFTVPSPTCNTMPISYKCGADQPCSNVNTYNANGQSNNHKVHLRASTFDANCNKTGDDTNCSGNSCSTFDASETHTDVLCHGGSTGTAIISATGGTPPYSGTGIFTGLSAGTYNYTVTDNSGCSKTVSVTIGQPDELHADCSSTPGDCHSDFLGSACVVASGGTGSYSYSWQAGGTDACIYGLTDGDYPVTVTDYNQCVAYCTSTVHNNTPVDVSETHVDVSVNGGSDGSIDITVSGGVGPYTFLWNDGNTDEDRTGLSAGTYSVVVTDYNGCTGGVEVVISQPACQCHPPTNVTITPYGTDEVQVCWDAQDCANGYILQYQWKGHTDWNTVNVTAPDHCGIVDLKGHANIYFRVATVCSDGSTTTYTVLPLYRYTAPCTPPSNLSITNLTSTSATFHWTPGTTTHQEAVKYNKIGAQGTTVLLPIGTTSYTATGLHPSTKYQWQVKGDCWAQYQKFMTPATKLDGLDNTDATVSDINVYPNPASVNLNVDIQIAGQTNSQVIVQMMSLLGQMIYSDKTSLVDGRATMMIGLNNNIPAGLYVVRVIAGDQTIEKRVVINQDK